MNQVWETKDGRRRVRRDPPTIEEAVVAAQGLTDELKEQVEIVASLMEITADEARGVVLRMGQRKKEVNHVTVTGRVGAPRAVVVERRASRFATAPRRSTAWPIHVATNAPTTPRIVVRIKPAGLFGPGAKKRAMRPATKPMMIIQT